MSSRTLDDWLQYQQQVHTSEIDLGLERIGEVWQRLRVDRPLPFIITVAGTNGKGSSVAYLEAILAAAGYRVGSYTSPHLVRYNERIRINGTETPDVSICAAFERIEEARQAIPLTYFEFGTLAAMLVFEEMAVEVIILEVGLGGRLDAANLFDADAVIITSIGLDHTDWLGDTLDAIAREKAGVMRKGAPAVIAQQDAPAVLADIADQVGATPVQHGKVYKYSVDDESWNWLGRHHRYEQLPMPAIPGEHQLENAAAVIALIDAVKQRLPVEEDSIRVGLKTARLEARFQVVSREPLIVLDVAHNREAAVVLARTLRSHIDGQRWHAVMSMYADKPIEAVADQLGKLITHWHLYALQGSRAASTEELAGRIKAGCVDSEITRYEGFDAAYESAISAVEEGGGVVIFGSFEVAGEAIEKVMH